MGTRGTAAHRVGRVDSVKTLVGSGYLAASSAIRTIHGRLRSSGRDPDRTILPASSARPRVLVVSPFSVHPMIHGGAVRIFNLIRELSHRAEVSVLIFGGGTDDPPQRAALQPYCRRVLFQRYPEDGSYRDPWKLLPPSVRRFASEVVAERIAALVEAHLIDVVMLEYTEMGCFVGPYERARVVLVEHDVSFRSHARQRSLGIDHRYDAGEVLGRGSLDWLRRYHFELAACRAADQIHVMSATDGDTLASLLPDGRSRIRVIPNGVDTDHFRPPSPDNPRRDALFVGSFPHLPNQDAFDFLVSEIWPRVLDRLPSARLTVAGARPPRRILDLDGANGIHVVGEVPDLAPLYQSHRVLTVPIRAGSGTRLKILEAMASGLPVATTTIGAEGIDYRPGTDLVIADDAPSMASAIANLLEADDGTAASLATNGRRLVTERYAWDRIADDLHRALSELVADDVPAEAGPASPSRDVEDAPDVSIVIPVRRGGGHLQRCLDGLARQHTGRLTETIAVDLRHDRVDHALLAQHRAAIVRVDDPKMAAGSAANLGARTARGRVLVYLAEDAVPAESTWLESMVSSFDRPDAPAAVQGGLHTQLQSGGPPYDPYFTAETRKWREAMDGFAFSLVNAAVQRRVWARFPFAGATLVGRHWQRQARTNGLLILPRWDAVVHWLPPAAPLQLAAAARHEGRAWKTLGIRYTTGDMIADMRRRRGPQGSDAEAAPTPPDLMTRGHSLHGLLRPFFLWIGNRLP